MKNGQEQLDLLLLKTIILNLFKMIIKFIKKLIPNIIKRNIKKLGKIIFNILKYIKWLFFAKKINKNIVIIDSMFPQKNPMGFRNYEITKLLDKIPDCESFTMNYTLPGPDAFFSYGHGMDKETFNINKEGYLNYYPENKNKVNYINKNYKYKFKLAYSYFLAETYTLLPFYKKNKIPFVFVLFPGGAFGLNNISSDKMLKSIFSSKYFRGVITTQPVTLDYINNNFNIDKEKIFFRIGGYNQLSSFKIIPKKKYNIDKNTFDICFCAFKYSERGIDKGYDLFVDTARYFYNKYSDIQFHVLGNFDENDIDVSDIKNRIFFYGPKQPEFFIEFFSKIDIFLSPNRLYKLYPGNFDGFPLGGDCMICGVALFTTDELNNNRGIFNDNEIVIIKPNLYDIVNKIDFYYKNIDKLYELSENGQKKAFNDSQKDSFTELKEILYKCSEHE
jgi:hypothetical protein